MARVNNEAVLKNIYRLKKKELLRVYSKSLTEVMLLVRADAMRLTPVKTGNLRSSYEHEVEDPKSSGIRGYLYNIARYALYVHEITTNRHKTGEAKFLEKAVNKNRGKALSLLAKNIKQKLKNIGDH